MRVGVLGAKGKVGATIVGAVDRKKAIDGKGIRAGDVLIGEVSTVNNDLTDNIFAEPIGRFAEVEEDEAPLRLLVSDYRKFLA